MDENPVNFHHQIKFQSGLDNGQYRYKYILVDREGNVVERYSPTYKPEDMEEKIKELKKK